jgi:uroporphyrinogen-III synthase
MSMQILITRPREDAERFARQLEAKGHGVLVEPLFTIEPEPDATPDLDNVQALLLTSANGARAFASRSERRDLRVFAVGDATADVARALGFSAVESAGGDVDDLARLVRERARPEDGALLHAAGSVVAGDLAGTLGVAGFEVRRVVLYRAEPVAALSDAAIAALREGRIDVAVFFSPRTARQFVNLAEAAGVDSACARVALLGLSPAVVAAAEGIAWAERGAAASPNQAALLAAIDELAARHEQESPGPGTEAVVPVSVPPSGPRAAPPAATTRSGAAAALAGLALVVALGAAGWVAWREFEPRPDANAQRLETLEQRIATLQRDLAARQGALDQFRGDAERRAAAIGDRIAGLEQRLPRLSESLNGLSMRIGQVEETQKNDVDLSRLATLTAENRRLSQELARLQETVGALDASLGERSEQRRGDSLVLALGQIREQLARGVPYAGALATARALAAEDQAVLEQLAALEPAAERGAPARAVLHERFDAAAAEAVRSDRVAAARGWWRPIADRLSSLVSLRRVGAVEGDGTEAILARAEQRLAADDLGGAIAELERLQGPAAAAMQGWLADARARAVADAALGRLTAHVLRQGPNSQ